MEFYYILGLMGLILLGLLLWIWKLYRGQSQLRVLNIDLATEHKDIKNKYQGLQKQCSDLERSRSDINEKGQIEHDRFVLADERLKQTQTELRTEKEKNERLQSQHQQLQADHKKLEAELERSRQDQKLQQAQNETHLKVLKEQRTQMTEQFENLANKIFEEKTTGLKQTNQESLKLLLNPFREQLGNLKQQISTTYDTEAKERHSLNKELKNLRELNTRLNREAGNLTMALKGDNKIQGTWGELKLSKLLEQAGMEEGTEYQLQPTCKDKAENRVIPDAIIKLPGDKDIVVDAKMSLVAHAQYHAAENEVDREIALKEHVRSLENHVKSLSGKYTHLQGIRSLDFVLMFVPVEAAYILALQEIRKTSELGIFERAMRENIMIVGPSTLMVTLRTISHIWRLERQERRSEQIAQLGAELYDKFRVFANKMENVDKSLKRGHNLFEEAWGSLSTGKGNLVAKASRFLEMGVMPKKKIPQQLMTRALDTDCS